MECYTVFEPKTIKTISFNPAKFLGKGWKIWKCHAASDRLYGNYKDVYRRALSITKIELSKFVFRNCLKEGEDDITGEEKIQRLSRMPDFIGFGPNVFLGLWEDYEKNREYSALEWLYRNFGVSFMDFPGAILRTSKGRRALLYLDRSPCDGLWHRSWCQLDDGNARWTASYPSVGFDPRNKIFCGGKEET